MFSKKGQRGTDEMDGSRKVGGDLPVDLFSRELFRSTEQAIARVADDYLYPLVPLECVSDGRGNALRLDQIELNDIQAFAVFLRKFRQRPRAANRCDHVVSLREQLLRHLETEPRGSAGDKPCLWHVNS